MSTFIADNMRYPEAALKEGVQGTVKVRYDIDHKGNVVAAKVLLGIGSGCDEEAIRLVKLLKFVVGKNRGVRAVFHNNVNINFKLTKTVAVELVESQTPEHEQVTNQPMQLQYTVVASAKPAEIAKPAAKPSVSITYKISTP